MTPALASVNTGLSIVRTYSREYGEQAKKRRGCAFGRAKLKRTVPHRGRAGQELCLGKVGSSCDVRALQHGGNCRALKCIIPLEPRAWSRAAVEIKQLNSEHLHNNCDGVTHLLFAYITPAPALSTPRGSARCATTAHYVLASERALRYARNLTYISASCGVLYSIRFLRRANENYELRNVFMYAI